MVVHSVKRARNYTDDIEFSCEDAGRTPTDNLCRIVEAAINTGVHTINIPDTVGYKTTQNQFGGIITSLFQRVPNIYKTIISVHCHDNLGMAASNSIAAIQTGTSQVRTLNGIGERADNTAPER